MSDIEFHETTRNPSYGWSSDDGLISIDIDPDEHRGGYRWDVVILGWCKPGEKQDVGIYQRNGVPKSAKLIKRSHGHTSEPEEAMAAARAVVEAYEVQS